MNTISPKVIKTNMSEIWLDDTGILRVKIIKEGEVDLEEVKAAFAAYRELGCHKKKVLQFMDFTVSAIITKEARDYVDKVAEDYFIASAVVTQSLPVRIIVNFCMKFFKSKVPLKMFSNEDDAVKWLKNIPKGKTLVLAN